MSATGSQPRGGSAKVIADSDFYIGEVGTVVSLPVRSDEHDLYPQFGGGPLDVVNAYSSTMSQSSPAQSERR